MKRVPCAVCAYRFITVAVRREPWLIGKGCNCGTGEEAKAELSTTDWHTMLCQDSYLTQARRCYIVQDTENCRDGYRVDYYVRFFSFI